MNIEAERVSIVRHTEAELTSVYNRLLKSAKAVNADLNFCSVRDSMCERRRLKGQNFCCSGCRYLSKSSGCMTNSLLCTIWICSEVLSVSPAEKVKKYTDAIAPILEEANKYRILGFRESREETINRLIKNTAAIYYPVKIGETIRYLPRESERENES